MDKNYYELLGVERSATTEEIKERYKEIARVYHPDSRFFDEIIEDGLSKEQEELFSAITNAYNTLINSSSRAEYDETLPPELKGWDDISPRQEAREKLAANSKSPTPAFGTFGAVKNPAVETDELQNQVKSVSTYIKSRRGPLPLRIIRNIIRRFT